MEKNKTNTEVFFALVRAGLWEKEARLLSFGEVDYDEVMRLAEEQSVVGLVAAGIDGLKESREDGFAIPLEMKLQFIGQSLQLEQENAAMNRFIEKLIEKMRHSDGYAVLVKGQGVAQCYERPLWRSCGDVDLLLSHENYDKAKELLAPLASSVETEWSYQKHLSMTIDQWIVELHGSLRTQLSSKWTD